MPVSQKYIHFEALIQYKPFVIHWVVIGAFNLWISYPPSAVVSLVVPVNFMHLGLLVQPVFWHLAEFHF